MKIYKLICQSSDDNDECWKLFLDKDLADFWCDAYNKQVEEEFGDTDDVFYFLEEDEVETTRNVDDLYGNAEPVQINVIVGMNVIDELFKARGLC